jgi:transposase-like protein
MGSGAANFPLLKCLLCGEHLPIKSNQGVAEELHRIGRYLKPPPAPSCPDAACGNHAVPAGTAGAYYSFGKTEGGSKRYQCRLCKKTFSVAQRATLRQREPRKNVPILKALMGKSPLARIVDQQDISFQTLYDKLDFFYARCLAFAAKHEAGLPGLISGTKRYIAVDRQDYSVNWTHRKDKRNIVLRAIGSADLETGYVFGMHLNFDGSLDPAVVEEEAQALGDYAAQLPFRRHARLWLAADYTKAVLASAARIAKKARAGSSLGDDIQKSYADAENRSDVESPELVGAAERFPQAGMQVRTEYTMYAHFYWLRHILGSAAKTRFFMDQESGIRAACLAAFEEEVRARTCDAFYVRLAKEMTVDEKRRVVAESRHAFYAAQAANPTLSAYEVEVLMMKEEIARAAAIGKWSDRWAAHPFPNQAEPLKAICHLTDLDDPDPDHQARLFLRASLHPIDRFFMSIRRRLNMLERPIGTASKLGRTWYGYSAYQPENIEKLLTIFRVFYNFCIEGKDKKTPAVRLGLAERVIKAGELLEF